MSEGQTWKAQWGLLKLLKALTVKENNRFYQNYALKRALDFDAG